MLKLAIIGAGNMGGAIIAGAIDRQVLSPADILVIDSSRKVRERFAAMGCPSTAEVRRAFDASTIILAIKPQQLSDLADELGELPDPQVVISVMAGLSSNRIREKLGRRARVIRVMPNTPCCIGTGMTAIAVGEGARKGDAGLAHQLFAAVGEVIEIDESLMNAVTAVSGSGPAYVYLLAEALQQAAEQIGLPHGPARLMVQQMILGAARMMHSSDKTASDLRQAVTSPGGTTAAALEVMFERELPEIVAEAVLAARDRGIELDLGES